MLRPRSAALVVFYCWALVVGLELFNNLPGTRQGVSMKNKTAVGFASYLPTALVVLLGIFWKRLVVDLKLIVPWSCLSQQWTVGKDSILLNYLDDLELSLIWPCAKRRHWALLLGLLGGLLSGGLVPLANSLVLVVPSGVSLYQADVLRHSFDFNDTRLSSNTSLNLLKSFLGNRPWAGTSNVLATGGNLPAWTVDSFVFAPFELIGQDILNQTVTANTTAITAELHCDYLRGNASTTTGNIDEHFDNTLEARHQTEISLYTPDYDSRYEYPPPLQQIVYKDPDSIIDPPVAWLNMTPSCPYNSCIVTPLCSSGSCMTLTVLQLLSRVPARRYRVTGLMCSPRYQAYIARVTVNASTGIINAYHVDYDTTIPVDIRLSLDDTIGYLNNPRHPDTIMGLAQDHNEYQVQDNIALGGAANYLPAFYTASSGSDPFGTVLLDLQMHPIDAYFEDPSLLEVDASRVFATTMTQLFRSFAIDNKTAMISGQVETIEPMVRIQQPILRVLEAFLLLLSVIMFCCAWPLRPSTILNEDPTSLLFIAQLVSRNPRLDRAFAIERDAPKQIWRTSNFRLRQDVGSAICLDIAPTGFPGQLVPEEDKSASEPLQLRTWARLSLLTLLGLYIITLGVLYQCGLDQGYLADDKTRQIAWLFVPTAVLVLIGYAVSGAISAVQEIAPLAIMRSQGIEGKLISKFNPRHRSDLTLPYHALLKKAFFPVLLAAIVALVYPVIKIVAADLYETFEMPQSQQCQTHSAPIALNLSELIDIGGGTQTRLQNTAAMRTDWVQIPELGVQSQPNVIRNLIFQEELGIKCNGSIQGSIARTTLDAISVELQCDHFEDDEFTLRVAETTQNLPEGNLQPFVFKFDCRTAKCQEQLQYQFPSTESLASRESNWTWAREDPYSDDNHNYYGFAGNTHSLPSIQVLVVDFSTIGGPVTNLSYIAFNNGWVEAEPGMFNVSLPTIRAVSCTPAVYRARVQATLETRLKPGLNGQMDLLPWAVTDFDNATIQIAEELDISNPGIWRKMFPRGSLDQVEQSVMYHDASYYNVTNWSGLNDDEIQPASSMASNFFELLASYERSNGRNVSTLLNVTELGAATGALYGIYNAELLSHFRQNAIVSGQTVGGEVPVQLSTLQGRVRPNPRTTFAVIGMLLAILLFLIVIFGTTHSKNVLCDEPGMIGSQLSLFAGSSVVQRLRGPDPDSVWHEKFSLGWWHTFHTHDRDGRTARWGVDVGVLDDDLQADTAAHDNTSNLVRNRSSSFAIPLLGGIRAFRERGNRSEK